MKKIFNNSLIALSLVLMATGISLIYFYVTPGKSVNIVLIYTLSLIFCAKFTDGYIYTTISSIISATCVNCFFIEPYFSLNFSFKGYYITFLIMLFINYSITTLYKNEKKHFKLLLEQEKILHIAEEDRMKNNMLRSISHDLRTPLTNIMCASADIADNAPEINISTRNQLNIIKNDAEWLLEMFENQLTLMRLSDNTDIPKKEETAEDILLSAISKIKNSNKNAMITARIPDDVLIVLCDPTLIRQVLVNLIDNALQHSQTTRSVECFLSNDDKYVYFHVKDYGIRLPEHVKQYLTNMDTNASVHYNDSNRGSCIGISVCKSIIHAHNGVINVTSDNNSTEIIFGITKGIFV